jgi:hypothetical protein
LTPVGETIHPWPWIELVLGSEGWGDGLRNGAQGLTVTSSITRAFSGSGTG